MITDDLANERNRWKPITKLYGLLRSLDIKSVDDLSKLSESKREEFDRYVEDGHPGGAQGLIEASIAGGKHPKDELAKLCGNTVYGDLVSRFFPLSNPLVGNNITARVRAIIWYFEKSCRAWNSITDGGLFDLNEVHVIKGRNKLTEQNTVFAPTTGTKALSSAGIQLKPLGHHEADPVINWSWNGDRVVVTRERGGSEELEVVAARKMVDELTLQQVRLSFSHKIAVINPSTSNFEFESKGIIKDAAIHGTANYMLRGGFHESYGSGEQWTIKFRSYSSQTHEKVLKPFFDQLIDNPEAIDRSRYWEPFRMTRIVKVRAFAIRSAPTTATACSSLATQKSRFRCSASSHPRRAGSGPLSKRKCSSSSTNRDVI